MKCHLVCLTHCQTWQFGKFGLEIKVAFIFQSFQPLLTYVSGGHHVCLLKFNKIFSWPVLFHNISYLKCDSFIFCIRYAFCPRLFVSELQRNELVFSLSLNLFHTKSYGLSLYVLNITLLTFVTGLAHSRLDICETGRNVVY